MTRTAVDGVLSFTNEYTDSKTANVTKPDKPTKIDKPEENLAVQTGDNAHPYILLAMAFMSLIGLMMIGRYWRRKTKDNK